MMALSSDVTNGKDRLLCLKKQTEETCIPKTWAGLIHLMAFSSVVRRRVFSVYPNTSPAIRSLFHGIINPRQTNTLNEDAFYIMFTRDGDLDSKAGTNFQPNHFCPLIPMACIRQKLFSYRDADFLTAQESSYVREKGKFDLSKDCPKYSEISNVKEMYKRIPMHSTSKKKFLYSESDFPSIQHSLNTHTTRECKSSGPRNTFPATKRSYPFSFRDVRNKKNDPVLKSLKMSQTCQNKHETSDFITKTPFPCLPRSWYKKRGILAEGEKDDNVEMTEFESIIEVEKDNNNKDTGFYSTAEKENGNSKETEFYSTAGKENGNSKETEFYSTAGNENGNNKETEFYSTAEKENGNNKETGFHSTAEKENGNNKETEFYSTAEKENGNNKETGFYSTAEKESGNNKETEFYSTAEKENGNNKETEFYLTAGKENGNSKETGFYSTAKKENGNDKETGFHSTAEKENGNNKETEFYSTAEKENGNNKETEFYSTAEKENGSNKETEFYSIAEKENSNNEPNIVSCSKTDHNVDREYCSINQGPFPLLSRTWYGIVGRTATRKKKDLQNINEGRNSFVRKTWLPLTISHDRNTRNNHPKQFPLMKKEWYKRRGKLATKNIAREKENIHRAQTFSENSRIGMEFSFCAGTLTENLINLRAKLALTSTKTKRADLAGIIKTAEFIQSNGPIVATTEAAKIFYEEKAKCLENSAIKTRIKSSEFFQKIVHFLNLKQVYIFGKAFVMENHGQKVNGVIDRITKMINIEKIVNDKVLKEIGDIFKQSLNFLDTKRDRDVLKGLFSQATSASFVARLQNVSNKCSIMNARDQLREDITRYEDIIKTSRVVRNDMTNAQQSRLTKRIVEKRKQKEVKLPEQYDNRGRMLKYDQFPEMPRIIEGIFEGGSIDRGCDGGLESHPRLITSTRYKSIDNVIFMHQARKILRSCAPPGFTISLSSWL